ncbi:MAG: murein L,D-transpeptidase catalytic domain family protein [Elusimicrobia bacterium]|nr:murein L,D-transpeptidase catalytic domain family protein [Elusimicrobiota bacterium]
MKNIKFLIIIPLAASFLSAKTLEDERAESIMKDLDTKKFKKICDKIEDKDIKKLTSLKFSMSERKIIKNLKHETPDITMDDVKRVCKNIEEEEKISYSVDNPVSSGYVHVYEDGDIEIKNAFFEPVQTDENLDDGDIEEPAPVPSPDYSAETEYIAYYNPPAQTQRSQEGQSSFEEQNFVIKDEAGLPADLKQQALDYFKTNYSKISNKEYIGVVDFGKHSSKSRFFIIGVKDASVTAIHVAHGAGSDPDNDGYATFFSNRPQSKASSVGFYLTGGIYDGKYGKSLKLHGLSSTNSNAFERAVVLHPSAYVREANAKAGRSWGCLAVSFETVQSVINKLKGGALIYASVSGR